MCISRSPLSKSCVTQIFSPQKKNVQIGLGFVNFFFLLFAVATYYKGAKKLLLTKRKQRSVVVVVVNLSSPDACETRGSDTLRSPPPTGGTDTPLAW